MAKDDDFLTRARPWQAQSEATCPVDPEQKKFIESSMLWLADQFGRNVARREIAAPRRGLLSAGLPSRAGSDPQSRAAGRGADGCRP